MRLRKIVSLIGVSALAASMLLTGCEKKEESNNNDSKQAVTVEKQEETTEKKTKNYDLLPDWNNLNVMDYAIQIGDILFSVGCTGKELVDDMSESETPFKIKNKEQLDEYYWSGTIEPLEVYINDVKVCEIKLESRYSEEPIKIGDFLISSITFEKDIDDLSQNIYILDGTNYKKIMEMSYDELTNYVDALKTRAVEEIDADEELAFGHDGFLYEDSSDAIHTQLNKGETPSYSATFDSLVLLDGTYLYSFWPVARCEFYLNEKTLCPESISVSFERLDMLEWSYNSD